MRGRYNGCRMTVYGYILPGAAGIARSGYLADKVSERARYRIKVIDWYRRYGRKNISLAARHFGLDRETIRIWLKRFKEKGVLGLNDVSHRPHHLRKPTTPRGIVIEVVKLRRKYPAWSKYKIEVLLKNQNLKVSASTIARILKRYNLINKKVSKKRRKAALSPKNRFPRGYKISSPGDMIQMDTKHIMLIAGKRHYQFTAIDVLSKKKVIRIYSSESSKNGADFLGECIKELPFSIKAVQTDNGSCFLGEFRRLCRKKRIPQYFIHPRTPKENTYVEISQGADKREFYQQGNVYQEIDTMRQKIKEWQDIWNNIRPHQSLNYLTPNQYYNKWKQGRLPTKDVITLQT